MKLHTRVGILAALILAGSLVVVKRNSLPSFGSLFAQDLVYQCPMDPDVRSNVPGKCPRCGMELRAGIPEPTEFPMDFSVAPQPVKPGQKEILTFGVRDPENSKPVQHYQIVHEKYFHLFLVSQDLNFFHHEHPVFDEKDSKFRYEANFPSPGMYRVLGDFFPDGATPQLSAKTVVVPGGQMTMPRLKRAYGPVQMETMKMTLATSPEEPIAGTETRLLVHLDDAEGLELYLGAWAHMLAASDDLIDLIHSHPYNADGSADLQFRVYFPRGRGYRVWFQFQKKGVVNTGYFDVRARELD